MFVFYYVLYHSYLLDSNNYDINNNGIIYLHFFIVLSTDSNVIGIFLECNIFLIFLYLNFSIPIHS